MPKRTPKPKPPNIVRDMVTKLGGITPTAKAAKCSRPTVYRMLREGEVPAAYAYRLAKASGYTEAELCPSAHTP